MGQHVSDPVYLGDFKEDATVDFQWGTYDDNNASVTRATDGTVQVYKDNGVTQSVAGITDTEDFDSLTGLHACTIDLSADAFYSVGSNYTVVVAAATIDGDIINSPIAHFSIENRSQLTKATLIDTVTIETLLTELMSRTSGKYTVDDPATGDITFLKRDSAATSHVVNVTNSGRTRTSP